MPEKSDLKAPMVAYAQATAKRGLPVIALHHPLFTPEGSVECSCGREECGKSIGKHPVGGGWQRAGTKDLGVIRERWTHLPEANIGIPTGLKWGLVVLDADGPEGLAALADCEKKYGPLPRTPTSVTGSGGEHRLFSYTGAPIRNSVKRLGPNLDVRGENGQIVAPPSLHRNGRRYRWKVSPVDVPLAPLPEAWAAAILELAQAAPPPKSREHESTLRRQQGVHRAAVSVKAGKGLLWRMMHHPLIEWMCERPDDVPREVWRGVAVNLCAAAEDDPELLEVARRRFHVVSEDYRRYSARECDRVFDDAIKSLQTHGPMRFSTMVIAGAPEAVCIGGTALIDAARDQKL
jgi:hypothetical protein